MQEKGIKGDVKDLKSSLNLPSSGHSKTKFNAFKQKNTPAGSSSSPSSSSKEKKPVQITYGSETYELKPDGSVDEEAVKVPKGSVIELSGVGEGGKSFADIKVCVFFH